MKGFPTEKKNEITIEFSVSCVALKGPFLIASIFWEAFPLHFEIILIVQIALGLLRRAKANIQVHFHSTSQPSAFTLYKYTCAKIKEQLQVVSL